MRLKFIIAGSLLAGGYLLSQTAGAAQFVASSGEKLWISDASLAAKSCKGVIVANTYGTGERVYNSTDYRALAAKWDFALCQLNTTSGLTTIHTSGNLLFSEASTQWSWTQLADFSTDVLNDGPSPYPFIFTGVSLAGQNACSSLIIDGSARKPYCIAAVNYRGRFYYVGDAPVDPIEVPARPGLPVLSVMSYNDDKDVDRTGTCETNLRDGARDYWHAPWTGVIQQTANHNDIGDSFFATEWLDAVIAQRLPAGAFDVVTNPLNAPESGAGARGGDYALGRSGAVGSQTYAFDNPAILTTYVANSTDIWLPNQTIADLWLASCSNFTISASVSGQGTTTPPVQQVWGTEDAAAITASPSAGHVFVKWMWTNSVDGAQESTSATLSLENVVEDTAATAVFAEGEGSNIEELSIIGGSDSINYTGSTDVQLENLSGGDMLWDVGETFSMEFDIIVTNPVYISNSAGLSFGIGDNADGLGFGIRYSTASASYWNVSVDASAASGGTLGIAVNSSSDRTQVSAIEGTAYDLRSTGEQAHFSLTSERTTATDYDITVIWADSGSSPTVSDSISRIRTTGVGDTIDSFTELLLRVNTSGNFLIENLVMKVSRPVEDPYADWTALYPSLSSTNLDYDAEPDGMDNFLEYALGGNPTNHDAVSMLPTESITAENGTNWLNYIYRRRRDTDLNYVILENTGLTDSWATNNTELGSGIIDTEFEIVTNRMPITSPTGFLHLKVYQ